jgi:hypothetical protein
LPHKEIAVAYLISLFFGAVVVFDYGIKPLLEPKPFTDVKVRAVDVTDGIFNFVATFYKTEGCDFKRLTVVGYSLGENKILRWWDNDSLPERYPRSIGFHTLRISADVEGVWTDRIEIRTRHDCGGEIVDKVFAAYP